MIPIKNDFSKKNDPTKMMIATKKKKNLFKDFLMENDKQQQNVKS